MSMKRWEVGSPDKKLAKQLAEELDIDPIVALIAAVRGYDDPAALEEFLSDEPCCDDPYTLADITVAADIINAAVADNVKIAVFGDYDCDGVVSTVMLYKYLKNRGADCTYVIPDRMTDGYGMNAEAIKKLNAHGVELIITVDNGISCKAETDLANSLGMTVVITDHHLPPEVLPSAAAIVDPHRRDCPSEFKEICGAEVVFKLICVLEQKEPEEMLYEYADILSLAVIADVMPLVGENRMIVKFGTEKIKNSPCVGIAALADAAGIDTAGADSSKIAFGICPRINAAGRMESAYTAADLLLCENINDAEPLAAELDGLNTARRAEEKRIFDEACEKIEKKGYNFNRVIVVDGENWHKGVVGIVASRITEKYGIPAVVIAVDGENATGSGRSIEGISLFSAVKSAADVLLKFGGHELAAGVSLKTRDIPVFRKKINDYSFNGLYIAPTLKLDCRLNPAAITTELAEALETLKPYGNGNPEPLFGLYGVTVKKITPIGGGKHLRLGVEKNGASAELLLFGVTPGQFCFYEGDVVDAAVTVAVNVYNGRTGVSARVKAIRPAGTDDEGLFRSADNLNRYMSGKNFNVSEILPSRTETGEIYRFIAAENPIEDRIKYAHLSRPGYAKTVISLLVLSELGLIKRDSEGTYSVTGFKTKTELTKSKLYSNLLERSGTE